MASLINETADGIQGRAQTSVHHGKFRVEVWENNKLIHLGSSFATVQDAAVCYARWAAAKAAEENTTVQKPLTADCVLQTVC